MTRRCLWTRTWASSAFRRTRLQMEHPHIGREDAELSSAPRSPTGTPPHRRGGGAPKYGDRFSRGYREKPRYALPAPASRSRHDPIAAGSGLMPTTITIMVITSTQGAGEAQDEGAAGTWNTTSPRFNSCVMRRGCSGPRSWGANRSCSPPLTSLHFTPRSPTFWISAACITERCSTGSAARNGAPMSVVAASMRSATQATVCWGPCRAAWR